VQRVLITGGAGFIGANLVRTLAEDGIDTSVLDDLSEGRRSYLEGLPVTFIEGSVGDARAVGRAARGADAIVHLAARSGVVPSVLDPRRDFEVNVRGTFEVLDAARRLGVPRVVFASSGAVLAGAEPPLSESIPPQPRSPYGASKLYGEGIAEAFEVFDLRGIRLRFSNVYGPLCAHKKSVVAAFLRRALRRAPFIVYGSGRQTRDFLYVADVVAAIRKALTTRRSGTYQLGSGVETSVLALARLVARTAGVPLRLDRRPARSGEAGRNYVDPSKARTALRWKATTSLVDGLAATYAWMASDGRS
jgi:UDP-glucose 4-epimerase